MDEIDVSGQIVAVWCDDAEARGFIERALTPLAVRIAVVRDIDEIHAARPACVLFHLPPREDPVFLSAWEQAQQQSRTPSIITRVETADDRKLRITRYGYLFDDYVNLPLDEQALEELMMRVRRTIQRRLLKGPLMDQPPAGA